jgi:prepilin peptidase CpaA
LYETLILSVFPLLIVMAGISDYFTLKIPNWVNGLIAFSVIPFVLLSGMPLDVFAWHVAAGVAAFIVGYMMFAGGLIGGGDAKMLAACALWIGWDGLMQFAFYTAMAGGVLATIVTVWRHMADKTGQEKTGWAKNFLSETPKLPYGIAIAVGGVVVFPATWWIQQLT